MKTMLMNVMAAGAMAVAAAGASAAQWDAFQIRDNAGNIFGDANFGVTGTAPPIAEDGDGNGVTTSITLGGQKSGYGTSDFNGASISSLYGFNYTRVDDGNKSPYLNLWVTDGSGNYAIFAPFINAGGTSTDVRGQTWGDLAIFIYETNFTDLDWIQTGAQRVGQELQDSGGNRITISQLSHLTLGTPGSFTGGFIGSGAPRHTSAFNIIFGDTQTNYVQVLTPYQIDDVEILPEPASLVLFAASGLMLLRRRRR